MTVGIKYTSGKKVQKNSEDDNEDDEDNTEEGDWSDDDAKAFGWNFIL